MVDIIRMSDAVGLSGERPGPLPVVGGRVLHMVLDAAGIELLERADLLDSVGLRGRDLLDVGSAIPLISYMRLLDLMSDRMGNPALGLDLSDRMGPELIGAAGYVFLASPTLDAAITAFSQSVFSIQGVTELRYRRGPEPVVRYTVSDERMQPRRHDVEFSLGYVHRLIKMFLREPYAPNAVHFEHPRIGPLARYERMFGCPVHFDQPVNAILLNPKDPQRHGAQHDPHLIAILEHYMTLAHPAGSHGLGTADQVDQMLSNAVTIGKTTCRLVAARMGVSEETLRRRMRRENSSFRMMLRAKRSAMAERLLRETDLSILEIAQRAGYAETASFSRAFKSETGQTPSQFRRMREKAI